MLRVVVGVLAVIVLGVAQTKTALISGRVVDSAGASLRYATVTLVAVGGNAIAATDESGQFLFAGISSGKYDAHFQAPGFKPVTARVRAVPGREIQLGPIAVEPSPTYTQNVVIDPGPRAPSAEELLNHRLLELPLRPIVDYEIVMRSIF